MTDLEEKSENAPESAAGGEQPGRPGELEAVAQEEGAAEQEKEGLVSHLAQARQEAKDLEDRMLRLAAEFENFKKRMQRERETAFKYAEEGLLKELLPSIDNLERAIEQGKTSDDATVLLEGIEMTHQGLLNALERFGLKPIAGAGQPFDPNFHEALAMEASDEVPQNIILQEYQKGYLYKDRLIRAAKVVVSRGSDKEETRQ